MTGEVVVVVEVVVEGRWGRWQCAAGGDVVEDRAARRRAAWGAGAPPVRLKCVAGEGVDEGRAARRRAAWAWGAVAPPVVL